DFGYTDQHVRTFSPSRVISHFDELTVEMAEGLLAEVIRLGEAGYGPHLPSMSGLGYRQLLAHLAGEMTLEEAVERIKFETHRFARQQATWFRGDDLRIRWFEADDTGAVVSAVEEWLRVTTDDRP
ncbi:MAG TPA: hypothetical protein PLR07_08860, partial [Promineifilum sp.]|nr:hypothetical protein [Promineifilum sp.]